MHDAPSNYRLDMLASIRKKFTLKEKLKNFVGGYFILWGINWDLLKIAKLICINRI
jgi:hypothetical protein